MQAERAALTGAPEQPVSGLLAVLTPASDKDQPLQYGDTVQVTGRLERPSGARNPGGYGEATQLALRGIYARMAGLPPQDWGRDPTSPPAAPFFRPLFSARDRLPAPKP